MSAHLQLTGGWADCVDPACSLLFHLPLRADEVAGLPTDMLYPLLEAIDPPTEITGARKVWRDRQGLLHRDYDLPAAITHDGLYIDWYQHGDFHREHDLPSRILNGTKQWYRDGLPHRDNDLPAVLNESGDAYWYQEGMLHRDADQPAMMTRSKWGWYQRGKMHRAGDRPALVHYHGQLEWCTNGYRDRGDDKPAVVNSAVQEWWVDGNRHRLGAPAVINSSGIIEYFEHGEQQKVDYSPEYDLS